jgi:hypothetical protein
MRLHADAALSLTQRRRMVLRVSRLLARALRRLSEEAEAGA